MAKQVSLRPDGLDALMDQLLETERGGVEIYGSALESAVDEALREEWEKYLKEPRRHSELVGQLTEKPDAARSKAERDEMS